MTRRWANQAAHGTPLSQGHQILAIDYDPQLHPRSNREWICNQTVISLLPSPACFLHSKEALLICAKVKWLWETLFKPHSPFENTTSLIDTPKQLTARDGQAHIISSLLGKTFGFFFLKAGQNNQRPVHSVGFRVKSLQHWFDLATDNWLTNAAKCQQAVIF